MGQAETFERRLHDHVCYQRQLERMHAKHQRSPRLYQLAQDGIPLATMILERRRVSRLLARSVKQNRYRPQAATLRVIQTGRKERSVYVYPLIDRIVLGALAQLVDDAAIQVRSDRLFSYQAGVSSWSAIGDLARFVRERRAERPNPRERWLYLLRRDVTSYTDSIPTAPEAPLWSMIREILGAMSSSTRELVELAIRPEVLADGELTRPDRGLPLGQPISGVVANLYLQDLDAELEAIPGGFYARYGDDMVFAHTDAEVTQRASAALDATVERLGLSANADKDQNFVLTGAGRTSADWPEAYPSTSVDFLGAAIHASGTVGLTSTKARQLTRDLTARARRANRAMGHADEEARGRSVCAAINEALDDKAPASHQAISTGLVRRVVTDRGQLADLDRRIASVVIGAVTGRNDVRAMRRLPPRRLHQDWGLLSLQHARNRHGRATR